MYRWNGSQVKFERGHSAVRFLFEEQIRQRVTIAALAEKAGVCHKTMSYWKTGRSPNIANIEACLNVLGYALKAVPRKDISDV